MPSAVSIYLHTPVFSKTPGRKSYFRKNVSIWKDFLLEEEIRNHTCPPRVSMLSPVFCNPSPLVVLSAICVTGTHCLIFMLYHFETDESCSSFLLLNNIQSIGSQPNPRSVFSWGGACCQRASMKEKLAQPGIRFIITDYSQFLIFAVVML